MTPTGYWHETVAGRERLPPLRGRQRADVVVVGGGYTGWWTALALRERDPGLVVVVCEAQAAGFGASGRNGGFADPSLTHGLANGVRHFGAEIDELQRLAADNWAGFVDVAQQLDCDFEAPGMLDVAVADWQLAELAEQADLYERHGEHAVVLDGDAVRARVRSPLFRGGLYRPEGGGLVNPAKLAVGLRDRAVACGVEGFEATPVTRLTTRDGGVVATTPQGAITAERAVVATNAYGGPLVRRTRRHYVPVYDHILVSEPLSTDQRAAIGWQRREGVADSGNQFHYFRLTVDDRILWGGYDALYHFGNRVGEHLDHDPVTSARLETHFRQAFPQLADLRFTHRWGGAIATTTRFTPVFGDALGGRVSYALGYTGLGVVASRFAARVLAEKVLDPGSPLLSLQFVRRPPFPFPPEPLRWTAVTLVRRALVRADRRGGRRGPLLGALDRLGVGFDS